MRKIATIKERILQYLENEGISKLECYRNTGMTNSVLSKKEGLSEDNLLRFISYYRDVNPGWLLTGEGDMLVSQENISEKKDNSKTTENVPKQQGDILGDGLGDKRKLQKTSPNNNILIPPLSDHTTEIHTAPDGTKIKIDLHTPKATRTDMHGASRPTPAAIAADIRGAYTAVGAVAVPVVDIEAAAGGGAINSDYFDEADVMRLPASMLPRTSAKRLCISVSGESMEPTIYDGTRIVVRLLDRSEWARIRSGEVYVVTDRDGNSYVKRLRNNLETSGRLILTSDNPNQRKYTPLPLMEDEISNIWTVELVISDIVPPSERDQIDDLRDEMRDLREWVRNMQNREK